MSDMTTAELHAAIDEAATLRRLYAEAEVEHYRLMGLASREYEHHAARLDALLAILSRRSHAFDPIDPSDAETCAEIAAAWAGVEAPVDDLGYARACRAVVVLASHVEWDGQPVQEFPGLIRDDHGCWIADKADPVYTRFPTLAMGCAREW